MDGPLLPALFDAETVKEYSVAKQSPLKSRVKVKPGWTRVVVVTVIGAGVTVHVDEQQQPHTDDGVMV